MINAATGVVLRSYPLQTVPSFINDVTLTGGAAWYTDSTNPVLFKLPLGRSGKLPAEAVRVPLTGDIAYTTSNNANGIAPSPDGRGLIIVQSNLGKLFRTSYVVRRTPARFTTPPTPETEYTAVGVRRP